jgi:hypothetical protein
LSPRRPFRTVARRLIAFVASSVASDALDRLLDAGGYDVMLIDSLAADRLLFRLHALSLPRPLDSNAGPCRCR